MDAPEELPLVFGKSGVDKTRSTPSLEDGLASSGDQYSREFVELLLAPHETFNIIAGELDLAFTDKALIVMAIYQAKNRPLTLRQILACIQETFSDRRFQDRGGRTIVRDTLKSETALFMKATSPNFEPEWQLHPELRRTLLDMKDHNGRPFDPIRHITHDAYQLSSATPFGPWPMTSPNEPENIASENDDETLRFPLHPGRVTVNEPVSGYAYSKRKKEGLDKRATEEQVKQGKRPTAFNDRTRHLLRMIAAARGDSRYLNHRSSPYIESDTGSLKHGKLPFQDEGESISQEISPPTVLNEYDDQDDGALNNKLSRPQERRDHDEESISGHAKPRVHDESDQPHAFDEASEQSQPANTLDSDSNAQVIDTAIQKNDGRAALGSLREMSQSKASDVPPEPHTLNSNNKLLPDGRRGHTTLPSDAVPYHVAGKSKRAKLLLFAASSNYDTSRKQQRFSALDDSRQSSGHDVDGFAHSPNDDHIPGSSGTACTVLELLLEPQWASPSKGNRPEQPFTEKALIVMAFGHTELQNTTNNWKPATRRISAQNVMLLYHRLPARFRKRIASAYRATAEDIYSSKAAHVHLSFRFIHKRAKDPTHNFRQGWRVAEDFHLGRDSISPRFALAVSVPVEQHLLKVSKTMVYIARVQTDHLERDNRNFFAVVRQRNKIQSSTSAHLTLKDVERLSHTLALSSGTGTGGEKRHRFLGTGNGRRHTADGFAALNSEMVSLNDIIQTRTIVLFTELAFVFMPLSFAASFFGMQGTTRLELEIILFISCLGVLTVATRNLRPSARTIDFLAHQLTKAPVPPGMKRISWQCRCGKLVHDDYFERKPHTPASSAEAFVGTHLWRQLAASAMERIDPLTDLPTKDHNKRGVDSSPRQVVQGGDTPRSSRGAVNSPGSIWASLGETFKGLQKSEPTLPQHDAKNGIAKGTKAAVPPKPDHLEYLLLCIPFKSHANKLMNIDTTTPPSSDIAFFRLLRQTYVKNRGAFRNLFSIRALSEIRFVQFEVFRNDLADVRKFDCIPPEAQKDNYLYRPMPAEFEPPIGKNQMRHLYDHPDHADDLPVCYSRVPRKLRKRLAAAPGLGRSEGWGICFIEGVSWPRVCALGLAGVLASTIFGVVWTVVQKDIQGGFGVASYMLGVLVLGLGALQGAFEM
jgi:hypothetical protein